MRTFTRALYYCIIKITGTCFVPGCQVFSILKLYFKSKEWTFPRSGYITSLEEKT